MSSNPNPTNPPKKSASRDRQSKAGKQGHSHPHPHSHDHPHPTSASSSARSVPPFTSSRNLGRDYKYSIPINFPGLTEEQVLYFKDAFLEFSNDQFGKQMEPLRLLVLLKTLGIFPSDDEYVDILNEIKLDSEQMLTFEEFLRIMDVFMKRNELTEELEAEELWEKVNPRGHKYVDEKEMECVMYQLGEKLEENELEEMIEVADKDEDGVVDQRDFRLLLNEILDFKLEAGPVKQKSEWEFFPETKGPPTSEKSLASFDSYTHVERHSHWKRYSK